MYVRRGGCNVLVHRAVVRCKFSSDTNLFDAGRLMVPSKLLLSTLHKCHTQEHTNDGHLCDEDPPGVLCNDNHWGHCHGHQGQHLVDNCHHPIQVITSWPPCYHPSIFAIFINKKTRSKKVGLDDTVTARWLWMTLVIKHQPCHHHQTGCSSIRG